VTCTLFIPHFVLLCVYHQLDTDEGPIRFLTCVEERTDNTYCSVAGIPSRILIMPASGPSQVKEIISLVGIILH